VLRPEVARAYCGEDGSHKRPTVLLPKRRLATSVAPPPQQRGLLLAGSSAAIDEHGVARPTPGRSRALRPGSTVLHPAEGARIARRPGDYAGGPSGVAGSGGVLLTPSDSAPGAVLPMVTFRYRTVEFSVTAAFYDLYLADLDALHAAYDAATEDWAQMSYGMVSSTNGTIDRLWSDMQKVPANFAAAFDLIGCYNLHRGGEEVRRRYRFWRYSWGAPLQVHLWTHQMILNFSTWLDYGGWRSDVEARVTECKGMKDFVETLLNGGSSRGRDNWREDSCYLTISYRSDGSDPHEVTPACEPSYGCDDPFRPDGDTACTGLAWDDWTLEWQASERCFTSDGSSTGECERPDTAAAGSDCAIHAFHKDFAVNLHASELAYQGAVCDYVMFLARLALDYADWLTMQGEMTSRVDSYKATADLLGRYVLIVLAYNGRHWIHEIGHAWLGSSAPTYDTDDFTWAGPHCEFNCCNDVVADNWWCKVRGWMGLPYYQYESYGSNDFDPGAGVVVDRTADSCSTDVGAVRIWSCDVIETGSIHEQAKYCGTGCYVHATVPVPFGGSNELWLLPDGSGEVVYVNDEVEAVCPA
jgi:hypothetical protein